MPSEPEFPNPEGFGPPQGVEPDQEFEAVAVLRLKPDGDLCLVSLDGSKFERDDDNYEDESEEKEETVVAEETTPSGREIGFAERLMS